MPVRDIVLYPNPVLRQACQPAEADSAETQAAIRDLVDTFNQSTSVGIAAPQIGVPLRIIVVDASRALRPVDNHGRMVLINPEIVESTGKITFREGCMSIPDLVAHVPRAQTVSVLAHSLDGGAPSIFTADGFEAVILQHEIDHLDGVLFIDRVKRARDIKPRQQSE